MRKTIYFIRHGETDSNITGAQQTPTEPLNATGQEQARIVAARVKHLPVERLLCSSMTRAQETAGTIGDACGLTPEPHDLFRELAIPSELEGALPSDDPNALVNQYKREREQFAADPERRFADGENFTDLLNRCASSLAFLATQPESRIAVISHGRFLRTLAGYVVTGGNCTGAEVVTFSNTLRLTNAGISVFHYENDEWRMLTWNDMAHFADN